MEQVPIEVLREFYMHGDSEAIIKQLEEYCKGGLDHMVVWNATGMFDLEKTRDSFRIMKEILSYIKG